MIFGIKDFQVKSGAEGMVSDGKGGYTVPKDVIFEGRGYIDFQSDTDSMTKANTIYPDATHILIYMPEYNDYRPFVGGIGDHVSSNGTDYVITYVDDVLNIGHHLEIPLRENPKLSRR